MVHQSLLSYQRIACALLLFVSAMFIAVALVSFDAHDPSFFYDVGSVGSIVIKNYAGKLGASSAAALVYLFDFAAFLLVPFFILLGLILIRFCSIKNEWSRLCGLLMMLVSMAALGAQLKASVFAGVYPGGALGNGVTYWLLYASDGFIAYAAMLVTLCAGLLLVVRFAWVLPLCAVMRFAWVSSGAQVAAAYCLRAMGNGLRKLKNSIKRKTRDAPIDELELLVQETMREDHDDEQSRGIFEDPFWKQYGVAGHASTANLDLSAEEPSEDLDEEAYINYEDYEPYSTPSMRTKKFQLPSKKIFQVVDVRGDESERSDIAEQRAENLEKKLEKFGVRGEVTSITIGPVVTLFEYAPASDVKVSKILALEDDLALALEALSLRILAPIPGKPVVGFEVANRQRDIVPFAELVTSPAFTKFGGALPLIIGRDTVGDDLTIDLAEMPHLLVAGSTGSGKSVALNAMLTSLLCCRTPDELQLILIDPKRLEFASFADIAHLVFPIVTNVHKAPLVLKWAVQTMEERYDLLAKAGVRSVQEYQKRHGVKEMPHLVIVIDELADLMMTVGKEVEELIARLAQMARAAGIHMIVATQRPSVDVITGLIKVNFPSRIAFKVTSKVDSRTILDCSGAEKLLGKGDMLFLNQRGMLKRVHGAYVRDEEINSVVSSIKQQREVEYQELHVVASSSTDGDEQEDPLYEQILAFVETVDHVSISLLQRKFRIGYNRSARIIDTLESHGVIMPADGGKLRKVLPQD